jgi:hypothetical protein
MPPLFYGTSPIKKVSEVKYLELYMNEQLNFKRHIEKLRGKISPMVVQTEVLFAIKDTEINLPCIYSQEHPIFVDCVGISKQGQLEAYSDITK